MPGRGIDHEHDDVRLGDRQAGLLLDARLDRVVRVELQAAGVDEHEAPAVPLGVAVQPVARRPGAVLDDRRALAEDRLKSVLLPTFGRPDDGDDRERPAEPRRRAGAADRRPTVRLRRRPRRAVRSGARSCGRPAWRPRPSAAPASSAAGACDLGRAGQLEDALGDVAQVLDRRRRAAGDADDAGGGEDRRGRSGHGRPRPGSPASRRSRTAGSAPWCWRSTGHRRRPSGRRPSPPPSCPAGGGS